MDLCTRRVVGSAISDKPNAQLVIDALEIALETRGYPNGLMFHSDQGSQYASRRFRRVLWRHRVQQSMSRRGNCWDNSPMERLFRSLKSEWVPPLGYRSLAAAKADINDYFMRYYNWRRHMLPTAVYHQAFPRINLIWRPRLCNPPIYNRCFG